MPRRAKIIPFGRGGRGAKGPGGGSQDAQSFVEVSRCRDQAEALVVKGLLESDGIPCLLRSRLVHSLHPFTVGDQGEVVVLVRPVDESRARILLARIAPGPSFP